MSKPGLFGEFRDKEGQEESHGPVGEKSKDLSCRKN